MKKLGLGLGIMVLSMGATVPSAVASPVLPDEADRGPAPVVVIEAATVGSAGGSDRAQVNGMGSGVCRDIPFLCKMF